MENRYQNTITFGSSSGVCQGCAEVITGDPNAGWRYGEYRSALVHIEIVAMRGAQPALYLCRECAQKVALELLDRVDKSV
jgi:hypothetical protein